MIPLPAMQGKTAAVLGLGLSGRSATRALLASGARVWAWDDDPARRFEAACTGGALVDLAICNWSRIDCLVLSPGIPLHHPRPHPVVRRAREAGVRVIGDLELLVESHPDQPVVGITGTNGKSTTTAVVGTLLHHAGVEAQIGGNIGLPLLDLLLKPGENLYVLELSSYQLELSDRLRCHVAVILNLSPDHLERHGGMPGYVRAKQRILRNQEASDWAVIGVDDEHGRRLLDQLVRAGRQRVLPVAVGRSVARGIYVEGGRLYDALAAPAAAPVADLKPITRLRGAHNWQNAAAAYAVARALGVAPETAAAGLARFEGLAHRMETVATDAGVLFVNDSKATNPEAAARALASFERIHWIAGGRPKQAGLDPLLPWLDRVRHAYLIGEAAAGFERALAPAVPCTRSGNLATAVAQAAAAARREPQGAVVLLAPACASFDQFSDFEARGDAFKALVQALVTPAPATADALEGGR